VHSTLGCMRQICTVGGRVRPTGSRSTTIWGEHRPRSLLDARRSFGATRDRNCISVEVIAMLAGKGDGTCHRATNRESRRDRSGSQVWACPPAVGTT